MGWWKTNGGFIKNERTLEGILTMKEIKKKEKQEEEEEEGRYIE